MLARLAAGELRLLVGTHALIEQEVVFDRLALAVVDEQHRFGVRQRAALDSKARGELVPHVLHLTATPIPRTLSLTLYGDLQTTALRELPAGRRPVKTWIVPEGKRDGAYEFIRERLREGRQCFVVCPLVEESEPLQARAANARGRAPGQQRVPRLLGRCHARADADEDKREVMARFAAGEVDVLVATSVIEVGIDVPNASRDGDRGGRPLRSRAAASAAGTGRARRARVRTACSSACSRRARVTPARSARSNERDGSASPR